MTARFIIVLYLSFSYFLQILYLLITKNMKILVDVLVSFKNSEMGDGDDSEIIFYFIFIKMTVRDDKRRRGWNS